MLWWWRRLTSFLQVRAISWLIWSQIESYPLSEFNSQRGDNTEIDNSLFMPITSPHMLYWINTCIFLSHLDRIGYIFCIGVIKNFRFWHCVHTRVLLIEHRTLFDTICRLHSPAAPFWHKIPAHQSNTVIHWSDLVTLPDLFSLVVDLVLTQAVRVNIYIHVHVCMYAYWKGYYTYVWNNGQIWAY